MNLIFHIDVNSAFLSWSAVEKLKTDPKHDLRAIPSIIGGDAQTRHGIVLAKSIPAKRYGVQTGEPVANALRKCPFLTIEPPDHRLYRQRSRELMELLHTYTSDIEQVSIDECYLDYTPISHRFSSPQAAARSIADRIRTELGFTVNIGIAPNKLLAKMASDFEKPDRVHTLFPEELPQKLWPLSVRSLFMVGGSSSTRLEQLGIHTIGELAHADPEFLQAQFKSHGRTMWEYANGIDRSPLNPNHQAAKGIGNSTTLRSDARTADEAYLVLLRLSEQVSARLRSSHQLAHTITVEIKYSDFRCCSRQTQLSTPIASSDALYGCACRLFDRLWSGEPIRLLGIRTTKLQSEKDPVQLSLFDGDFPLLQAEPPQTFRPAGTVRQASGTVPAGHTAAAQNAPGLTQQNAGHTAPAGALPDRTQKDAGSVKEMPGTPPPVSLEKQRRLDLAMDTIRKKYGDQAVVRGSLFQKP